MDPAKLNDLDFLTALLELMGRHGLSELEIESDGRKIRFRKPEPQQVVPAIHYPPPVAPMERPGAGPAPAPREPGQAVSSSLREITSPMVGTFYRAQSPEADPFVQEGDRVEENTILCLIEAMKVMNEIPAGAVGVVREILVKNGESVEYGQPLFRISAE